MPDKGDLPATWPVGFGRATGRVGDHAGRMPVQNRYLDGDGVEPARQLDASSRMYEGVGDKLAGQEHRIGHQVIAVGQLPGIQRFPDEATRGGHRSRFGVIGCGRDEIHVSCPLGTDGHVRWHLL